MKHRIIEADNDSYQSMPEEELRSQASLVYSELYTEVIKKQFASSPDRKTPMSSLKATSASSNN